VLFPNTLITVVKCQLKEQTSENSSLDGKKLVPMRHRLKCMIKEVHNRFECIPWGERIRVASLRHAEIDTGSFLSLYNIYRGSVILG